MPFGTGKMRRSVLWKHQLGAVEGDGEAYCGDEGFILVWVGNIGHEGEVGEKLRTRQVTKSCNYASNCCYIGTNFLVTFASVFIFWG